jgi:glycolate oxidase iron-sulfur subunit
MPRHAGGDRAASRRHRGIRTTGELGSVAALLASRVAPAQARAGDGPKRHANQLHPAQLTDPDTRESNTILRSCVHCGFCTATCPTFVLLGDELDSPRGRIYLIKDMLEGGKPATEQVVRHVDRCLSCLSCMTTCPSGVNYMHLVDHARAYIERPTPAPGRSGCCAARWACCCPIPAASAWPCARPPPGAAPAAAGARCVDDGASACAAMLALAPTRLPPASPTQGPQDPSRPRASGAAAWRC